MLAANIAPAVVTSVSFVALVTRSSYPSTGKKAAESIEIEHGGGGKVVVMQLDLDDPASINKFADTVG